MNRVITNLRNEPVPQQTVAVKTTFKRSARPFLLHLSSQEQIFFAKRLAMILRSGMPILDGLHMLRQTATSASARYIFERLVTEVEHGHTLSFALSRFERIFGGFVVNVVKVGEVSGTLHENLDYLAAELKRRYILKRKITGALVYPALIVSATIGITIMLVVYIFPKIIPIFQSVKAQLPLSTRVLIAINSFLSTHGLVLFFGASTLILVTVVLLQIRNVRRITDSLLLRLPIVGHLMQSFNLANICRTMSLLLVSDVRIVEALELVAASTRNCAYQDALLRVRDEMQRGRGIAIELTTMETLFPPLMVQMISVGETTGNLSGSFAYLSNMYEEDVDEITRNLTTLLEPALMIVMGTIVGFIAISIITPVYSITQSLQVH